MTLQEELRRWVLLQQAAQIIREHDKNENLAQVYDTKAQRLKEALVERFSD